MLVGLAYVTVSFAACLGATYLGAQATPYISFFGIGLTMVLKDNLQIKHGWRIAAFFVVISSLFPVVLPATRSVAIASVSANLVSGIVDVIVLEFSGSLVLSDVVSSFLDSFIFLKLAFGGGPFLAQSIVKFLGTRAWRAFIKKASS